MPKRRPGKTEASYEMSVLLPGESLSVSGSSADDRAVQFSVCPGQGKSETAGWFGGKRKCISGRSQPSCLEPAVGGSI